MPVDRTDGHVVDRGRSDWLTLASLFVLAVLLRVATALRTSVIFADGPSFVRLAERIDAGDWEAVLLHPYHPLYPLSMSGLRALTGDFETAGVVASVLAGGLSVVALYGFLRAAFDRHVATVGALLLCLLPYAVRFSSDVQSDGVYLALFLLAVWALWRALADGSVPMALLAGVLSALAYLTRPEGVGVVVAGLLLGGEKLWRREWTARQLAGWGFVLVAGFGVLAGPYLRVLGELRGAFVLSGKKSLGALIGLAESPSVGETLSWAGAAAGVLFLALGMAVAWRRAGSSGSARLRPGLVAAAVVGGAIAVGFVSDAREFTGVVVSSLGPGIVVLTALGIHALHRERNPARARFLFVFLGLYAVLLFALLSNYGYLSRRHALPPLTLLLGHAAAGVFLLSRWLRRAAAVLWASRPLSVGASLAIVLLLVAATELPKTLRRHREDALAHRWAAEWLRDEGQPPGAVAAVKLRTAYYAGRGWVPLRPRANGVIELGAIDRARYLIVDRELDPLLERRPQVDLVELHRVEAAGELVLVYRIVRRDS